MVGGGHGLPNGGGPAMVDLPAGHQRGELVSGFRPPLDRRLTIWIEQSSLKVMTDADASKVAHELRLAVGRLARRLRQLYAQGRGDQLTFTELAVLSRLHRDGPASASQLANGERVTAQAVGAAIRALHQRGLIQRTRDARDRRKAIVSLTDPGRTALTVREQAVIDRMVGAVASGYTTVERRRLAAAAPLLERLAELL
jgi:DNA-binding MarR family transcriptional regulator